MNLRLQYRFLFTILVLFFGGIKLFAQSDPTNKAQTPKWGPNDTIVVQSIVYEGEKMPYKELEMVVVSNLSPDKLAKFLSEYNRLRNAVYVTYPYARTAGATLNQINARLQGVSSKRERKQIIKAREKELKDQFSDPLSNLSVYQGKILMKLINRQTGNNCYDIIKDYRIKILIYYLNI